MQIKRWHLSSSPQNSTVLDESKSSLLLFDIVSTTFIPGKISSDKRLSKLRSIAELRAFYSIDYWTYGLFSSLRSKDITKFKNAKKILKDLGYCLTIFLSLKISFSSAKHVGEKPYYDGHADEENKNIYSFTRWEHTF